MYQSGHVNFPITTFVKTDTDWHAPLIVRVSAHATRNKRTRGTQAQGNETKGTVTGGTGRMIPINTTATADTPADPTSRTLVLIHAPHHLQDIGGMALNRKQRLPVLHCTIHRHYRYCWQHWFQDFVFNRYYVRWGDWLCMVHEIVGAQHQLN